MNFNSTISRRAMCLAACMYLLLAANSQILSYTNATTGALSSVAAHATGTSLARVNGATAASSPCSTGFSSANFSSTSTYASTLTAVQVTVTPATGYSLSVTGFSAVLRRSSTGPASLRYAYSLNGGSTWITQSANQTNPSASCGAGSTLSWNTSFTVPAGTTLLFRIYGFKATGTGGTEQILNLLVNGTVTTTCTAPALSTAVTNVKCNGGTNGAVNLTTTGGNSPFTYLWSNAATTQNISGVAAGTYKVTVTATGGCTATATASVTQPTKLTATISSLTGAACSLSNGSATVTGAGGTTPYTYSWNTNPVQTTATAGNLALGAYTVSVTDANSCLASASVTVSVLVPAGLSVSNITSGGATLNWGSVSGASSYNVQYRQTGTNTWTSTSSAINSLAISGLASGITYEFQVQTVCTGGSTSSFSASSNFTTSSSCGVPSGLSAGSITANSAVLSWGSVSGALSYNIQYRISGAGNWNTTTSTTNSVTIGGLTDTTVYQYQVEAVCSAGSSAYSTVSTFTTLNNSGVATMPAHMKVYFNRPVNTSVSSGVNAIYLNETMDDTLIAYINRAKYTIDIAQYNYIQTTAFSSIVTAINNAYARGVSIRWIDNGASSNSGLSTMNANIHVLKSPTTSAYNLMHDKFMIVDAHSSNINDPLLWTGSLDWEAEQVDSDYNNTIIIQDQALALCYTTEFNQMWGDTGLTPNTTTSKFGPYKLDITPHYFTIDGSLVECYFSPSDSVNKHIIETIGTANDELLFGVYDFTEAPTADSVVSRKNAGVYVAGIDDQYSSTSSPAWPILTAGLGSMLKEYVHSTSIYHNKMMIVDPCALSSDPLVLTGSHNWTVSADTKNDENILIIHNPTIANIYYQSFYQNYSDLGGTLATCQQGNGPVRAVASVENVANGEMSMRVFPNPANTDVTVQLESFSAETTISLFNTMGQRLTTKTAIGPETVLDLSSLSQGIYLLEVRFEDKIAVRKIIVGR